MAGFSVKVIGMIGLASYAMAYACARLRHVSYHRFKVVAVPVAGLPAMPRGYYWRLLQQQEVAGLTIDVNRQVQADRFAAGMHCLGLFDRRGELAGVSWLATGAGLEDYYGVRFALPPGCAWDTGLWVPPDKRMGRAFSALWAAMGEWLTSEGLDWTMSLIVDYNIPSLLAHRRLGARHLSTMAVLRLGVVQYTFGAGWWPRITRLPNLPGMQLGQPGMRPALA